MGVHVFRTCKHIILYCEIGLANELLTTQFNKLIRLGILTANNNEPA